MRLSFIYPIALWLLLLLPLLWAFTLSTRSVGYARLGRRRFWGLLALRSIALVALVLALAGTQLVRSVDDLTVVFLIDGSDSVSPVQREQAVQFVNDAIAASRTGDKAAVVVFGQNALVERAPVGGVVTAPLPALGQLTSTPISSRTNIEEAIQLGLALFPADSQKRLVLLSDGHENDGRAIEAARLAEVRGVPLDVVPMPSESGPDVLVSALDAPDVAREGQTVTLQVRIGSSIATSGQLQVFADGELVDTQAVPVEVGTTTVPVTVSSGEAGFRRYEVRLEAQGDTQPLNNRAAAFTDIQGPPRILLIASEADRALPLQNALVAASARVEVLAPSQVPSSQADLKRYAAIVLVDVLARDVPGAVQAALPVYVREQGGSLAMIGGRDSFGAGGWRRSPVAAALPVELDPRDKEDRPDLALTLVIDRSGSMASGGGGGLTKLDLAKEAVYQSSLGLEQNDQIGVVAFDTTADWIMPMQPLPDILQIEQSLSQLSDGGGTNIRSGIDLAAQALPPIDAKIKHVILLTDGIADSNYADLIDQMRAERITITVVSIGTDANPALQQIAERGGGRFYRVLALSDVPRIFLEETITVAGRDIVEGQFTPVVALPTPIVRALSSLPPLYGYNATEPRVAARTILVSPDGKPILAQWQYGLGRSVAWTSDFKGQWARDWIGWEGFPSFASGLLDALLPPQRAEGLALAARAEGAEAVLELTVEDAQGRPLEDVSIQGRLLDPTDQGVPLDFVQVGAGRYRAVAPTDTPGAYLAQVAVLDAEDQPLGSISGGLVVAYSPEYNTQRGTPQILPELAALTGGRSAPAAATVFTPTSQSVGVTQEVALPLLWLVLLLWPFDIALRRLFLRKSDVAPLLERLRLRFPRPRPQTAPVEVTLTRLQSARARAREGQRRRSAERGFSAESRQSPTDTGVTAAPADTPAQPAAPPPRAPSTPPTPAPPKRQPGAAARSDDALARLLVAKQRAQRNRRGQDMPERTEGET